MEKTQSDYMDELALMDRDLVLGDIFDKASDPESASPYGVGNGVAEGNAPPTIWVHNVIVRGSLSHECSEHTSICLSETDLCGQEYILNAPEAMLAAGYMPADQVVSVKDLEWGRDGDANYTKTIFGEVSTEYDLEYGWLLMMDGHDDSWVKYPNDEYGFPSESAAIEFVEAYTTRRILSDITIQSAAKVRNAALQEAAHIGGITCQKTRHYKLGAQIKSDIETLMTKETGG